MQRLQAWPLCGAQACVVTAPLPVFQIHCKVAPRALLLQQAPRPHNSLKGPAPLPPGTEISEGVLSSMVRERPPSGFSRPDLALKKCKLGQALRAKVGYLEDGF